jgi:beta-lactam-binding protein with PASTA domain
VPNVLERRSATAAQILQNSGFEVDIQRVTNDEVPADRVANQDPRPGEQAAEGSTVTIIVSDGPGQATIPAVEGQTQRQAQRALERAGFEVDVRREPSEDVRRGRVIETSPAQGSRAERGSTVTLTVSDGPEQVAVPDVVGESREEASDTLRDAGLEVSVERRESDEEEPGTVLEQSPAAGEEVDRGSRVTLTVAEEPAEVEVPAVVDQEVEEAFAALEEAGLRPRQRERAVASPDEDGVVLEQTPAPGERRSRGSRVTLVVGRFDPDLNPDPDATPAPSPAPTAAP